MGFLCNAFKVCGFAVSVCGHAACGAIRGTAKTMETATDVLGDVSRGDYEKACDRLDKRLEEMALGADKTLDNAVAICEASDGASLDEMLTPKNAKVAASLLTLGVAAGFAGSVFDGVIDSDSGDVLESDEDYGDSDFSSGTSLAAMPSGSVENGVFVGDSDDLQALIELGEDPDAEHVDAEDVSRSMSVRDDFLQSHGFDEVPDGYEVHHVQPLSEGGEDSVDNMILVSEDEHDQITAAHRSYYVWIEEK
jgi:hypothetical protein